MRLNQDNIKLLNNLKSKPNYNPQKAKNSILHFGVGNFHRAHQAFFIHEMLNSNKDVSIIGINLRSDETRRNLEKQNNYYSLYECTESDVNIHVLNPYKKLLFGLEDEKEICDLIANKETKIITITVTEKGYHYNTINKSLDLNDDIQNDLENKKIKTLIGHISYGLIQRFKENKEDIYIISCDNLSQNGDILKKVVTDFVSHIDKNIASWIEEKVKFPCTMVDCIVPNTKKLPNEVEEKFKDNSLVLCEPYRDWYIENKSEFLKSQLVHERIKFVDNIQFSDAKVTQSGGKIIFTSVNDEPLYLRSDKLTMPFDASFYADNESENGKLQFTVNIDPESSETNKQMCEFAEAIDERVCQEAMKNPVQWLKLAKNKATKEAIEEDENND